MHVLEKVRALLGLRWVVSKHTAYAPEFGRPVSTFVVFRIDEEDLATDAGFVRCAGPFSCVGEAEAARRRLESAYREATRPGS